MTVRVAGWIGGVGGVTDHGQRKDEHLVLVRVVRLHRRGADEHVAGPGARGACRGRLAPQDRTANLTLGADSGSTSWRRRATARSRASRSRSWSASGEVARRAPTSWRAAVGCSPVKASTAPLGSNGRANRRPQLDRRFGGHGAPVTASRRRRGPRMIVRWASCCSGASSSSATVAVQRRRPARRRCPRTAAGSRRRRSRRAAGDSVGPVLRAARGELGGVEVDGRAEVAEARAAAAAAARRRPGPRAARWNTSSPGEVTSTKAKRRISAYDISNSRFLSNTFIVAMIRHAAAAGSASVSSGGSTPWGTSESGLRLAGALERQHDGLARQHGEQLAEGAVEVRPVELVDHEPAAATRWPRRTCPGRKMRPSAVGWKPPIVSNVVHSVVAVVGR